MKTILKILILCGLMLSMALGCEKEKPETIEMLVELVNENNEVIDTFKKGDNVFFKFYLINSIGREVSYVRPNYQILDFLNVYMQINKNSKEEYEYIGNPSAIFVSVCIIEKINDNETKLIASVPFINDFNWPEMEPGNYYVGDTLNLSIDSERHQFESRIYFTIE